jgi:hypothetical protein
MYFTILTVLEKGDGKGGWRRGGEVKGKGIEKGRGCKGSVLIVWGCPHRVGVSYLRGGVLVVQYFPVPPQFLQDWPESCRTPQDSAGLQAKVLILVASPAKLGRT